MYELKGPRKNVDVTIYENHEVKTESWAVVGGCFYHLITFKKMKSPIKESKKQYSMFSQKYDMSKGKKEYLCEM